MISGDARTSEARAWCKEVHRGVTTERRLGRRSQQLHKLRERSDGSRTVLLLALKRLEFAFGFLLIDLRPTRRSDDIAAAARYDGRRNAKGGEFLPPERIMVLVLDAPRHA